MQFKLRLALHTCRADGVPCAGYGVFHDLKLIDCKVDAAV